MQTKGVSMTRGHLLGIFTAGIVALALISTPACAKVEMGDNATESLNSPSPITPTASDPSLALAAASESNDSLASFGPSSGTVVGNRALELRDSILRLRASVNLNSNQFATLRGSGAAGAVQYHSTVAAITARLQNGTTRGNPILLRQWDEANASLDEVTGSLSKLNTLETAVEGDASMASFLLQSVQAAFQLSGAVDEDHDQLKLLQDEVSRMIVQLDYLRNQTVNDIERQTAYLTTERNNLQTLAFAISRGEMMSNNLANRPVVVTPPSAVSLSPSPSNANSNNPPAPSAAPVGVVGSAPMSPTEYMQESDAGASANDNSSSSSALSPSIGRLLVLIRYNQPHVDYEQQLSKAVGTAMERRPNAMFSVVAVAPANGDSASLATEQQEARRNADDVKRSLVQLGLSPSRISMSNAQVQTAQTPEVHVYIR